MKASNHVIMDRATSESGENLKRLSIQDVYAKIRWYASYPNHYADKGEQSNGRS